MPRYYVRHEGKWNVFSTVVDDFLLPEFLDFDDMKKWIIADTVVERSREVDTLLTDRPELNVMDYEVAMEMKRTREEWEKRDDEDDDEDA